MQSARIPWYSRRMTLSSVAILFRVFRGFSEPARSDPRSRHPLCCREGSSSACPSRCTRPAAGRSSIIVAERSIDSASSSRYVSLTGKAAWRRPSQRRPAVLNYLVRRLLMALGTLVVVSVIAFIIIQLPPGDYVDRLCRHPRGWRRRGHRRSRSGAARAVRPEPSRCTFSTSPGCAGAAAAISASRWNTSGRSATSSATGFG